MEKMYFGASKATVTGSPRYEYKGTRHERMLISIGKWHDKVQEYLTERDHMAFLRDKYGEHTEDYLSGQRALYRGIMSMQALLVDQLRGEVRDAKKEAVNLYAKLNRGGRL